MMISSINALLDVIVKIIGNIFYRTKFFALCEEHEKLTDIIVDIKTLLGYIEHGKELLPMPVVDRESQKKMIGELLKNADKYIKASEWKKALAEVDKALSIEPNNMYAMAYKDRINASIAEEKKKAEEDKVKKLSDEKKPPELPKEEKKAEPPKEEKKAEPQKEEKKEEKREEEKKPETKVAANAKEDSTSKIESLRQEFTAMQAKLQREVAQLTLQVKEAQAIKEAVEKKLSAQIAALEQELAASKRNAGTAESKEVEALKREIETLKSKHQRELERAREVAKAEGIAQVAALQKEMEASKQAASATSLKQQGEIILRTMFQKAWMDGSISNEERAMLLVLKNAIEMTDEKFSEIEKITKNEAYVSALRSVWSDGVVTPDESDFLQSLREKLGVPAEEHFKLESLIRKELKK